MGLGRGYKNIELRTIQFFGSQLVRAAETETVFGTFRGVEAPPSLIRTYVYVYTATTDPAVFLLGAG